MKSISILLVVVLILGLFSFAYAKGPGDKLVRGVGNVLSGWLEIPLNIDREWAASKNMGIGIFTGGVKGLVLGFARTCSGFWDALTFPVAVPENYEPFYSPDYVFDKTK